MARLVCIHEIVPSNEIARPPGMGMSQLWFGHALVQAVDYFWVHSCPALFLAIHQSATAQRQMYKVHCLPACIRLEHAQS